MHVLAASSLVWVAGAAADPRPLPVSQSTETVVEGELRVTQIADAVHRERAALRPAHLALAFGTELEYGVLDRLDVAVGFTYGPAAVEDVGAGLAQRVRFVVVQPGDWWLDVAVIGEAAQRATTFDAGGRLALRATFDRVRVVGNAGAEYLWRWQGDEGLALAGSLAATYEIVPAVVVGAEAWWREHRAPVEPAEDRFAYAGPVVQLARGRAWLTVGAYRRLTADDRDRTWVRALVGFDL